MKKGQITIKDIANELGVSVATVSRALANNPIVKKNTMEAIKELAKKYRYQPNYSALSLKNSKSKTIGIIIPQIVHEFFALVIKGIEDYAYASGYSVIICSTHESYAREVMDAKTLLTGRIDGLLACISKDTTNFDHFKNFKEREIPMVFFDCICEEIESNRVIIDDLEAGYQATKHLIDNGCKHLAFLGGPDSLQINKDRFLGFSKALKMSNLDLNEEHVIHCTGGDYLDGLANTQELLNSNKIDGLFATTDMLAIGAIKNIKKNGLKIPEDIKVIGFSNWSISELYEPSLSTVTQPGIEMGKKAAELLIKEINNNGIVNYETVVLRTEVIQRESTLNKKGH